jgi:hypothetical protein
MSVWPSTLPWRLYPPTRRRRHPEKFFLLLRPPRSSLVTNHLETKHPLPGGETAPETADESDTTGEPSRYRASTLASIDGEGIEAIRRVVKQTGREVSFVRLSPEEKGRLADVVYTYRRQGRKTTENLPSRSNSGSSTQCTKERSGRSYGPAVSSAWTDAGLLRLTLARRLGNCDVRSLRPSVRLYRSIVTRQWSTRVLRHRK